jgi:tetratricopeptide (TPR) repeat protein
MEPIRAFVGHSFRPEDKPVVEEIILCLDRVSQLHPNFSWVHAQEPEPSVVDAKVLRLFEGKNLFIGICTMSEFAVRAQDITRGLFRRSQLMADATKFERKVSDWVLQEIGIAVGRQMDVILLVEDGVRRPGSLQGNLECIPFRRTAPEQCLNTLLGMIAALRPPLDSSITGPETSQGTAATTAGPPKTEPVNAVRSADGEDLEFALFDAVFMGKEDEVAAIEARFQASDDSKDEVAKRKWSANVEYLRIVFGRGGDVANLRRLAEQLPEIDPIWWDLALVYEKFDDFSSAGSAFERAAAAALENQRKVAALGRAAVAYHEAGDSPASRRIYGEISRLVIATDDIEKELLEFEVSWAETTKNDEMLLGALERLLQLNPTDHDRRFQLAYKCSTMNLNQLSTLHYQSIPRAARTAIAWNNLGVARTSLQLPAGAMTAFRRSEDLGETLAMSNIADRYLDSGFLSEAKDILERALSKEKPDKRVASVLNRASEVRAHEENRETELLEKAKLLSHFYREFGRALARRVSGDLASKWVGPDCELEMQLDGDRVTLVGVYEVSLGGLMAALMPTRGLVAPSPLMYRVEYRGAMRGHTIVGTVSRGRVDQTASTPSILGSTEGPPIVALLEVAEGENVIHVLERPKNGEPRTYELTRR